MPALPWISTLHDFIGGVTLSKKDTRLTSRATDHTNRAWRWDIFTVVTIVVIAGIWFLVCRWYLRDMICKLYSIFSNRRKTKRSSARQTCGSSFKLFRDHSSPTQAMCLPTHRTSSRLSTQSPETRDPLSPMQVICCPSRQHLSDRCCQAGTAEMTDARHLSDAFDDPERATHHVLPHHDNKRSLPKYLESEWSAPSSAGYWRSEIPPPYLHNKQGALSPHVGDAVGSPTNVSGFDEEHLPASPPPTYHPSRG